MTVVSSSGTNQLHGDLFEYLRNSALDARNFFDDTIGAPPFKRNQFGGALGGPLKKDKMFLFGNYEGFRERLAVSSVAIVPNAQARQGLMPCYIVNTAYEGFRERLAVSSVAIVPSCSRTACRREPPKPSVIQNARFVKILACYALTTPFPPRIPSS
ncbi:MAG: hypothetical protein DMG11_22980 [Acidobacteria bacterium]|nr:MAG: hypothetical protein DMG11_22980 [Acidobacteriota bacterium]